MGFCLWCLSYHLQICQPDEDGSEGGQWPFPMGQDAYGEIEPDEDGSEGGQWPMSANAHILPPISIPEDDLAAFGGEWPGIPEIDITAIPQALLGNPQQSNYHLQQGVPNSTAGQGPTGFAMILPLQHLQMLTYNPQDAE